LKDVPTQFEEEETHRRRKTSPGHQIGFKGSFVPGFQTKFNQGKSGYDLDFNGGGEAQGV